MDQAPKQGNRFVPGQSGNPKGRPPKERRDGWINAASGHGTSHDRRALTRFGVDIVTDLEAMQLWRSEWLCARVIETRPREAFRRGWDLKCDDKNLAETICAKAEELGLDAVMVKAGQYMRAYGGAAILPVVDGSQGDLKDPLEDTRIADVLALHVLEPRQLWPETYYTDLSHPKFGQPETWRFMPLNMSRGAGLAMQVIHESRLVMFVANQVSVQTQPGQREGWGDSDLSRPRNAIADYGLSWGSATTILHNFGRDVLQLEGWADLAAQEGTDGIMARRISAFETMNSTLRIGVIDAKDRFTPRGGSLAGLDAVLVQQAQYVAAACDMPVTVLMGMSPAGLNATGDMDVRNWYATIENDQATTYKPKLEQVLRLLLLSNGGKEPKTWSVEFRPLMTPSEKETAETRMIVAQTDQIYADMSAVSADDVAESRWKGDTYSAEMTVDWAGREELRVQEELRKTAEAALPEVETPSATVPDEVLAANGVAGADGSVQQTALNGAQVSSMIEVVTAAIKKEIPRESAVQILSIAFPITPAQATSMLGPSSFEPIVATVPIPSAGPRAAPEPPVTEADARADADSRTLPALIDKLAPSGKCASCGNTGGLEVDHVDGRKWSPNELSQEQRAERYWREHDDGVELRALCRSCNGADGARNKQEH